MLLCEEEFTMRKSSVLVLPAVLLTTYLMLDSHLRSRQEAQVTVAPQPTMESVPRTQARSKISDDLTIEVDGIRLGMSCAQVAKVVKARGLREREPRVIYDEKERVIGVVDGKSLAVVNGETTRAGQSKEKCLEMLGNPMRSEPGVAGCGLDVTAGWLFSVRGGGLRVYFNRDTHEQLEIAAKERSKLVSFDLTDTINGSYRGP